MKEPRKPFKHVKKLIREIYKESKNYETCNKFTGKESFDEICHLLLSPQGIEYCTKHNFPALELFDMFNKEDAEEKGIYINAGMIIVENKSKVLLVGRTNAILKYDNQEHPYNVILMHNATAKIIANKYAVVFTFGEKHNLVIDSEFNAIVK